MTGKTRYYSSSTLTIILRPSTNSDGSIIYGDDGYSSRSINIGSLYSKHLTQNDFGGHRVKTALDVFQDAGSQIHEYAESSLRFLNNRHHSNPNASIAADIAIGMQESAGFLRSHTARAHINHANRGVHGIVDRAYYRSNPDGTRTAAEPGSIMFASEQNLYSTLDPKNGTGVTGKLDTVYYDKLTNTVKIFDLKTTSSHLGSQAQINEKAANSFQTHVYPILVHDNFEKIFGFQLPPDLKYEMSYIYVPTGGKNGKQVFGESKTFNFDNESIQKTKAFLVNQIAKVETEKRKFMRNEQLGGSEYVKQYVSSIVGQDRCEPGACSICPMKLYCPNRSYQELVYEINNPPHEERSPSSIVQNINEAVQKDLSVSNQYETIVTDIDSAKKRAGAAWKNERSSTVNLGDTIANEYSTYKKVMPNFNEDMASIINDHGSSNGTGRAFSDAIASQEGLPVSLLDKELHPRWMNQKYGQQFAEHIETFARNVSTDVSSRFSMSPKAITDIIMERVFRSKKFASELDGIVSDTVKQHFSLQSKIARISQDDIHNVIDNIGGYLKDTKLINTVGEHVQMSTLAMVEQFSAGSLKKYMYDNNIAGRSGESQAEAIRWYISNSGDYEQQVQSTFEKVHKSPSFRGVLSKFSLSEKRFPLPMLAASMFLSYAGAQTMAQTQANLSLQKAQDYRRYQNEEIPEAGHAGVMSMAYRLMSSAFGSGFQKFRTTYQDIANRALMNNRLFKMFKDATSKAIVKKEDLTLEGGIAQRLLDMPTSVKMFAATGFVAAMAMPLIKSTRDIGTDEKVRAKRLKQARYGKTKSKGDSTSYQKSSDLRYGYKAHTGFGSPFNIGVFESLFVGLVRIASNELPQVIARAKTVEGKIESFFTDKVSKSFSTAKKSAVAMSIENINKNHINSVLTKQYENMDTLRSGEMRTLEVAKAQREADFHTFGVERANTSVSRIQNQIKAISVQENIAPDRMTATLVKKAEAAAREDAAVPAAVINVRSQNPGFVKIPRRGNKPSRIYGVQPKSSDKSFVEAKTVKHDHTSDYHVPTTQREYIRPKTEILVSKPRPDIAQVKPTVSAKHIVSGKSPVNFVNMIKNPKESVDKFLTSTTSKIRSVHSADVEKFARSNITKESLAFGFGDLPQFLHHKTDVTRSVIHANNISADAHAASLVPMKTSFDEYRKSTSVERSISKKASSEENRKRFKRQRSVF